MDTGLNHKYMDTSILPNVPAANPVIEPENSIDTAIRMPISKHPSKYLALRNLDMSTIALNATAIANVRITYSMVYSFVRF